MGGHLVEIDPGRAHMAAVNGVDVTGFLRWLGLACQSGSHEESLIDTTSADRSTPRSHEH
jgi:hypothetical protein